MSPAAAVLLLVWLDPSEIAWGSGAVARQEAAALLTRMGGEL